MPWYAVYTEARAEYGVAKALTEAGLDVLYLHQLRTTSHARRKIAVNVALYSRYLFARIDGPEQFHQVRSAKNVREILGRIPDAQIEHERTRADPTGLVPTPPPGARQRLAEGAQVMVVHGAFVGFPGTVMVDTGSELRLNVALFGRPTLAVVPADWVEIASPRVRRKRKIRR